MLPTPPPPQYSSHKAEAELYRLVTRGRIFRITDRSTRTLAAIASRTKQNVSVEGLAVQLYPLEGTSSSSPPP